MLVLVTGAGGFAGGHLARGLAKRGFDVVATSRASPIELPDDDGARRHFCTLTTDLAHPDSLPGQIDAIVHAAATSPWKGVTVDRMVSDNVIATQALVRWAATKKVRAFVFLSSISAFGLVSASVLQETDPSVSPDAYGATKGICEQMLIDVKDSLPSLAIRLPAIVGRGARRNWLSETLRKLRANEPIHFVNPSTRFNNAVHESDLVDLAARALERPIQGYEMVLAASSGEMPVAKVVAQLASETCSASRITSAEQSRPAFLVDTNKARCMYNWTPMPIGIVLSRIATEGVGPLQH